MATYIEIASFNDDNTKLKVRTATMVAAQTIIAKGASMTAGERAWAQSVLTNLDYETDRMLRAVLAANVGTPLSGITGATDAAVQTAVNNAVVLFTS